MISLINDELIHQFKERKKNKNVEWNQIKKGLLKKEGLWV
ncbi:MAG: hypothetical protein PWP52_1296 [Bacteroidales bacterium]|nr:hypothetical protein [Bacteroidales bacterium]